MAVKRNRRTELSLQGRLTWRNLLLLVVCSAFLVQSYLTQTHIHFVNPVAGLSGGLANFDSDASTKVAKAGQQRPANDKTPANDDPAKCPLCQAVFYAGHYVWPDAVVFLLPAQTAALIPVRAARSTLPPAHAFNWQGRGPPRL